MLFRMILKGTKFETYHNNKSVSYNSIDKKRKPLFSAALYYNIQCDLRKCDFQYLLHRFYIMELHAFYKFRINFIYVFFIKIAHDDFFDAGSFGSQHFLFYPTYREHLSA